MMKRLSHIIVGVMVIFFVSGAHAAYLVDTGADISATNPDLDSEQWIAGEFVLDFSATITDIEGWMYGYDGTGSVTIAISNDAGEGPGSEIYSQSFFPGGPRFQNSWHGISGLSWLLDPGTFWVSFEVRDGDTYSGKMGRADKPLLNNAYHENGAWVGYDPTNIPVRIQGDVSVVPIPGAIWLAGSGLIGLVGLRRKLRQ